MLRRINVVWVSRPFKRALNIPWSFENYLIIFFFSLLLSPSWGRTGGKKGWEEGHQNSIYGTLLHGCFCQKGVKMKKKRGAFLFFPHFCTILTLYTDFLSYCLSAERGWKKKASLRKKEEEEATQLSWVLKLQDSQTSIGNPTKRSPKSTWSDLLHPASIPLKSWIWTQHFQ